ncbi:MAG TPA: hypothetical protein VNP20_01820 [Nocardioidaceae bacterium]|nr:hypothetical protein [Nocardioidaceae bacterium]
MTEQNTETTEDTAPEAADGPETTELTTETPEDTQTGDEQSGNTETFPRTYVEKLRRENAGYRERAADRDQLAERLHTVLVDATGRLADPTDLRFDADHLRDADALTTAIDELLARKPHLASRRVSGDVGQGHTRANDTVDLAGLLRDRAR